jgi:hypothetical protein
LKHEVPFCDDEAAEGETGRGCIVDADQVHLIFDPGLLTETVVDDYFQSRLVRQSLNRKHRRACPSSRETKIDYVYAIARTPLADERPTVP